MRKVTNTLFGYLSFHVKSDQTLINGQIAGRATKIVNMSTS